MSVNEYRLRLGRYKGSYVRRCLVRAMYLSAYAVAVSILGALLKYSPLPFFCRRRRDSTKQLSRIGVGAVYWA